ncbi:MAG: serine hydrolase [Maribacter sp.]
MKNLLIILIYISLGVLCANCSKDNSPEPDEETTNLKTYFPLISSDDWETVSLTELQWEESKLQPLLDFLEEKNTKSFMILYKGRIAVEEYMNNHSNTTPWYWASAGKTLTTAITGIAQGEGLLNIDNKVSDYLGEGWTSATLAKENLITCKNLLSMNSGLDDSNGDGISPENLQYIADAGTRWAYHHVYVKLQDIVSEVAQQNWSTYFDAKLKNKIGMSGSWIATNDQSVYWSTTRSMARFGLLVYADGTWENDQIIPMDYLKDATNTSQNINEAYGYLWWLNGKSSYRLPGSQLEFDGDLIPNAPSDTFAALGKNDQKIYVVPSEELVIIRMGNSADGENFALSTFDNDLWEKINDLID